MLQRYDPNLCMFSLDEAKLDLSHYLRTQRRDKEAMRQRSHGSSNNSDINSSNSGKCIRSSLSSGSDAEAEAPFTVEEVAAVVEEMRAKVTAATGGLTCSAGIGPNFMVRPAPATLLPVYGVSHKSRV